MRALVGAGGGEDVGHQPGQHLAEQPADEADDKCGEDIRKDGQRLAHHRLDRIKQAAESVGVEDRR